MIGKHSRSAQKQRSRVEHYAHTLFQFAVLLVIAFGIRTFFYGLYQVPTGSMETTMLVGERFLADKLTVWFSPPKHGEIITFNDPTYHYSNNAFTNWFQRYIWGPSNWTKRLIGVPGDHVQGRIEDGKPVIYRNGVKLNEPYLNKYPIIAQWRGKRPSEIEIRQGDVNFNYWSYDPNRPYNDQPFYRINPDLIVKISGKPAIRYPGTTHPHGEDVFDVHLGKNEYWAMGDNRLGSWDSRGWGKLDGKLIHGKIIFRLWSIDSTEDWWIVDLIKHPIDFWKRMRWSRCFQRVK